MHYSLKPRNTRNAPSSSAAVTASVLTVVGVSIAALMTGNGAHRRNRRHLLHLH